jgi:hypothetical protein
MACIIDSCLPTGEELFYAELNLLGGSRPARRFLPHFVGLI